MSTASSAALKIHFSTLQSQGVGPQGSQLGRRSLPGSVWQGEPSVPA